MSAHGDHDMGHTVAGWTGTAMATAGTAVLGAGLAAGSPWGLGLGGAVIVLAVLTTWLLHLAGWGKPSGPRPPGRRSWRTRDTTVRYGHPGCVGCRLAGRRPDAAPVVAPHVPPAAAGTSLAAGTSVTAGAPVIADAPALQTSG
ncbi:HGxxPAAW family protein [Streptomyces sp. NPDC008141]|uniref:HGxxPAAW family protein n=1 Tax=Streptomyces sp. NPDC008141 TaxID=3364815 RepID=UPI0036EBB92D